MRSNCTLPTRSPATLGLAALLCVAGGLLSGCERTATAEAAEVRVDAQRSVFATPSAREAIQLLFPHGAGKKRNLSLLGTQTLHEGAQEKQVVFVSSTPVTPSAAEGAQLSAVVFAREGEAWRAEAVERNMATVGEIRMTDDPVDIRLLEIAPGRSALLVPDGGYFQGIGEEGVRILSYRQGHFADLGYVRISANNQGACEAGNGASGGIPCWEYSGRLSTQQSKSAEYFDLRVRRSGERSVNGRIVPATDVLYTFDGNRYASRED